MSDRQRDFAKVLEEEKRALRTVQTMFLYYTIHVTVPTVFPPALQAKSIQHYEQTHNLSHN